MRGLLGASRSVLADWSFLNGLPRRRHDRRGCRPATVLVAELNADRCRPWPPNGKPTAGDDGAGHRQGLQRGELSRISGTGALPACDMTPGWACAPTHSPPEARRRSRKCLAPMKFMADLALLGLEWSCCQPALARLCMVQGLALLLRILTGRSGECWTGIYTVAGGIGGAFFLIVILLDHPGEHDAEEPQRAGQHARSPSPDPRTMRAIAMAATRRAWRWPTR